LGAGATIAIDRDAQGRARECGATVTADAGAASDSLEFPWA